MGNEFLAAKEGDPLLHSSLFADFISGVVKGAVYAAIGLGAVALTGLSGGAALAVFAGAGLVAGFTVGDMISDAADWVADSIDDFFGLRSADGTIETGSNNVRIKGKGAARAAGKLPSQVLLASIVADKAPTKTDKGWDTAVDILKKATLLTPIGMLAKAGLAINGMMNNAAPIEAPPDEFPVYPSPKPGFWEGVLSPVKAGKHPNAAPMPLDTIVCTKWHCASAPYFLAEGSKRVQINSQPACRNGDRSTCEAKIDHGQEKRIVRIGGSSVVVRDITSGRNPFFEMFGEIIGSLGVGGMSTLMRKGGLTALRQCLNKVGCTLASEVAGTAVGALLSAVMGEVAYSATHPVHAATGSKVLNGEDDTDFIIEGALPLIWARIYQSRNTRVSRLGQGWALPFDVFIEIESTGQSREEEQIFYHDMSGRRLALGMIALGQKVFYQDEGFQVYRTINNLFLMESINGDYQLFEVNPHQSNTLRLTQTLDLHQNSLNYVYSTDGELVQIHDERHLIDVRLHYDAHTQRLTSVTRHQDQQHKTVVTYGYDDQQRLVQVTDADGRITRRFGWDEASGLLSMHQYPTGLRSYYRWQRFDQFTIEPDVPEWRVVEHWLQEDDDTRLADTHLSYDLEHRTVDTEQQGTGRTRRHWNEQQQVTEFTNELNETWTFEWDTNRQLTRATAPDSGVWQYAYDTRGNLILATDPEVQTTSYDWDSDFAFPTVQVLPTGATWRWYYTPQGDIKRIIDPDGHTTHFAWDEQGNCLGQVDAKGNETHYRYNARGQLIRQTDCSGYPTTLTYDDWGQLSSLTNALNETTTYTFSDAGLLLTERLPDTTENRYEYDATGQLVGLTDAGAQRIELRRNLRGQIIARCDPANHWLHFQYDPLGRLQALVNEKGEQYQFEYDARHRLIAEQDLIGQKKHYHYDVAGNLAAIDEIPAETGLGDTPLHTALGYDKVGRLLFRENSDFRTEYGYTDHQITLRRVPIAQWHAAQQDGGEVCYQDTLMFEYDAFGQLLREQTDTGGYQHSYDVLGNLTATQLAGGRRIEYLHYGSGHLQQVNWRDKDQLTVLAEYQRDRLHRETLRSSGQLDNDTGYDVRGRVTHQVARRMNESTFITPVIDKRYHWNKSNQLIERSVSYGQGDGLFTQGHWYYNSYQYDPLGQLTQHLGTLQTEQFLYDEAANLLNVPSQSAVNNQVQHSEKYDYQYDGFGRMAWRRDRGSQDGQRYHYDSEHRIMAVELTQGPIGYERAEYRYDILGRRTEKRLWKASTFGYPTHFTPREPDEVYRFSWVGMQLASEHHSSAPNTTVYHVYNDGSYTSLARIHCFDHAEKQTTEVYYSHCALNGLPEALTNADGQMVWQGQYGLWGNLQRQVWPTGHLSTEQNLRFQGQYFDKETGLHYNTFRYYSPDLGRFTQQDPIGLAGGLNLYQYAPNPLTWVDPWGLATQIIRYVSEIEANAIFDAKGLVLNNKSSQKAIWINTGKADFNPSNQNYRVVIELGDKGTTILNNHIDIADVDWKETGLKSGVLSKTNELGARGIGVDILKNINDDIKNIVIQKKGKSGKWQKWKSIC